MSITQKQKEIALEEIADILEKINKLYQDAAKIADNNGVDFTYHGPSGYGDGGYYASKPIHDGDTWSESDAGWRASSQQGC